jgi:hypothetical protein
VILLWPLLLVGAGVIAWKARAVRAPRFSGPSFYAAWGIAGALFMLSLVTGFTIGLFIFPVAAFATLWLAANAFGREAIAFPVGALVIVAVLFA